MVVCAVRYEPVSTSNLPDKWHFTGYFRELFPVIEKYTRIHCDNSITCKQFP